MENQPSLFLSYAGADRDCATRLKEGLVAAGLDHPLWQDIDQIRGGDNWLTTLEEALHACSGYVIVVGPGGIHRWVRLELYAAIRRYFESDERFPVFPVLLPGARPESLPSFLSIIQAERLSEKPTPEEYERLAQGLKRLLEKRGAKAETLPQEVSITCPWPGLLAYDESWARYFFGRLPGAARSGMILVDTSVWVDHLRAGDPTLAELLNGGRVLAHPFVIGELACGNHKNRETVLWLLRELPAAPVASDQELSSNDTA